MSEISLIPYNLNDREVDGEVVPAANYQEPDETTGLNREEEWDTLAEVDATQIEKPASPEEVKRDIKEKLLDLVRIGSMLRKPRIRAEIRKTLEAERVALIAAVNDGLAHLYKLDLKTQDGQDELVLRRMALREEAIAEAKEELRIAQIGHTATAHRDSQPPAESPPRDGRSAAAGEYVIRPDDPDDD